MSLLVNIPTKLQFSGPEGFGVSLLPVGAIDLSGDFTASFWMVGQSGATNTGPFGVDGDSQLYAAMCWKLSSFQFSLTNTANARYSALSSVDPFDGSEHAIGCRVSGTAITVWVDGIQRGSGTCSGTRQTIATKQFMLGSYGFGSFPGTIEDFRLWSTARSDAEMLTLGSSKFADVDGGATAGFTGIRGVGALDA